MEKMIKIKQIGSYIGRPRKQRAVLRGLGLGRMNEVVYRRDTPAIRGMVRKISHLVEVTEVGEEG